MRLIAGVVRGWVNVDKPTIAAVNGAAAGGGANLALILTGPRHSPLMDLDTALEWEAQAIAMALSTPEAREAFASFQRTKAVKS